jgi:DNA-binding transcriptional ArsR family regulator
MGKMCPIWLGCIWPEPKKDNAYLHTYVEDKSLDVKDVTIFAALADRTRRQLLMDLAKDSPKTATQLAHEYPITRPGIIKHLNILEEAGLVKPYEKGRDKRYVLAPEPLGELEQWIQEINDIWDSRLSRLKSLLENEMSDE